MCDVHWLFFVCKKYYCHKSRNKEYTEKEREKYTAKKKKEIFMSKWMEKGSKKKKKIAIFFSYFFLWKAAYNKLISSTSLNLALLTVAIKKLLLKEQKWILAIWFRWRIKRKQKAPFVHKKESSEGDSFLFYFTHQKNGCGTWLFFPRLWSTKIFVS